MNSEDNGNTTRPISRFSRASRDSVISDPAAPSRPAAAPDEPLTGASLPPVQQGDSFAPPPWSASLSPSLRPAGAAPSDFASQTVRPVPAPGGDGSAAGPDFRSAAFPSAEGLQRAPLFQEAPAGPAFPGSEAPGAASVASAYVSRSGESTPRFDGGSDMPVSPDDDQLRIEDLARRFSDAQIPSIPQLPQGRSDELVEPPVGIDPVGAPSGPAPQTSRLQAEFSPRAPARPEEENRSAAAPALAAEPPANDPEPVAPRQRSFSSYIPQQARELTSLLGRHLRGEGGEAAQGDSTGQDNSEEAGKKRFALVPYIPPQARGLANLLARIKLKGLGVEPGQPAKIMRYVRAETARVAARSAEFAAQKLAKAGQEVAHNLKASELKRNYNRMLAFAHTRVVDRKLDPLFYVPTDSPGRQLAVTTGAPVPPPASSTYEGPTPQLVFDWALAALPQDLREYTFVDFRAGRGRALMLAARRNFEKVIGYEFDDQTYDDLAMNVAQFPRSLMACRNIECIRGDRNGLTIPDQPAVLFFSNAHREGLLPVVLSYAVASYHRNPRSIYAVLLNPGPDMPPGVGDVFTHVPQPLIDRVKLTLLSPVKVAVYRTSK